MGKTSTYIDAPIPAPTGHAWRRQKWHFCLFSALLMVGYWSVAPRDTAILWFSRQEQSNMDEASFRWTNITPDKQLKYTRCFGEYFCARLDVPLNWNATNRDSGSRASIAVIKSPAKVSVTDERYGGAIIMNPGGPGESGVHQVLSAGKYAQTILDSPTETGKYFDIISFDPRGVNNTTPLLKCFPDAFNQQAWLLHFPDYSHLWSSEPLLGYEWSRLFALGGSCSREQDEDDMIRHVNTAQVVEDMVEIIERHGEWRQAEAERIITNDAQVRISSNPARLQEVVRRTAWKKGGEKLMYWGFSYGTLLGQTFSAMHPERVGRVVIDGVVDPADHYKGGWLTNLQDADMIITKFCDYCYEAGPEKCPLYTGNSGKDVEIRFEAIMLGLKNDPIPVPASGSRGPEVVTYGDVYLGMLTAMYFSYAFTEDFFTLLSELSIGNATRIASIKQERLKAAEITVECQEDGPFSDACVSSNYISGMGTTRSITCMDTGGLTNITKDEFKEYLAELTDQSRWLSGSWSENKLACLGFKVQPVWAFEGQVSGNTSHPLLIIGNTHDTVTPLRNAKRVSTLFPGSVVLQQDSEGHCSYSNPSICTGKILRDYFQTGALPEPERVCIPEYKPFIGCLHEDQNGDCRKLGSDEEKMWIAMTGIAAWS